MRQRESAEVVLQKDGVPRIRQILAVTGSRADWGLLEPLLAMIRDDPDLELTLAVTGQHLMPSGAASMADIEGNGFQIDARIDLQLSEDTAPAIAKAIGRGAGSFGEFLATARPDLVLVLGDRYELLAPVVAALIARVPIAHLCGGDITEGAIDDAIRHAITKMAHLHFVTNEDSARRVRQLGENPDHVYCVGSPGIDRIRLFTPLSRAEVFTAIGISSRARNAVVTFHPETIGQRSAGDVAELLAALDVLGPEFGLIFTGVNADLDSQAVGSLIQAFVDAHSNAVLVPSLGSRRYLSALAHSDLVIGNSSSGLYEAPSFNIPTVNIGDRQKGRPRAKSVVDCAPERAAIVAAIESALRLDLSGVVNPYGDGHASERIVKAIKAIRDPSTLLQKRFFAWQGAA